MKNVARWTLRTLALVALPLAGGAKADILDDWPFLANTLFPRQHADPRNSDHTPVDGPVALRHVYSAVTDYALTVGFQVGQAEPFCALFRDPDVVRDDGVAFEAADAPQNILCRLP